MLFYPQNGILSLNSIVFNILFEYLCMDNGIFDKNLKLCVLKYRIDFYDDFVLIIMTKSFLWHGKILKLFTKLEMHFFHNFANFKMQIQRYAVNIDRE